MKRIGEVEFDAARGELRRGTKTVRLTWQASRVCDALIQAQAPLAAEWLISLLWPNSPPEHARGCISQDIMRLRQALAELGGAAIVTRRYFGYEIVAVPDAPESGGAA